MGDNREEWARGRVAGFVDSDGVRHPALAEFFTDTDFKHGKTLTKGAVAACGGGFVVQWGFSCGICGEYVPKGATGKKDPDHGYCHQDCTAISEHSFVGFRQEIGSRFTDEPSYVVRGRRKPTVCNKCNMEHREDQECT